MKLFGKKQKETLEATVEEIKQILKKLKEDEKGSYEARVDGLINDVIEHIDLDNVSPTSNEYKQLLNRLSDLYKIKNASHEILEKCESLIDKLDKTKDEVERKQRQIPWKEIIVGLFGIAQIILILKHEEFNVITSKALNFVNKGRV